ncbi:MAG: DUF3592 domain-containing protein [Planctomycetaceae bacterium]
MQDRPFGCVLLAFYPFVFVISSYFVWIEFEYAISSLRLEADVERAYETVAVSGRGRRVLHIDYSFKDAQSGERRIESDEVSLNWPWPNQTVDVAYLPGRPGQSRLAENRRYVAILFFAASVIAPAIWIGFLYREARGAIAEETRNKKRRKREL